MFSSRTKFVVLLIYFLSISLLFYRSISSESVKISSYFDDDNIIETIISSKVYGSKIELSNHLTYESNYEFVLWIQNDIVRHDLAINHEFIITRNMELKAIFKETGTYAVLFMDSNGQLLDVKYTLPNGNVSDEDITNLPSKPGYIISPLNKWSGTLSNIQKDTILVLQYEKVDDNDYVVSVTNGSGSGSYEYNSKVTINANPAPNGSYFSHWQIDNRIVSKDATYTFTVLDDVNIKAVYSNVEAMDKPWVGMSNKLNIRDNYQSYVGQFSLPNDLEMIEFGFLSSTTLSIPLTLDMEGVTRHQANTYNKDTNEWLRSFPENELLNVRSYMVYRNQYDHIITIYDESIEPINTSDEIFFSEYGEGSSNNKWLELYNPTDSAINPDGYSIKLFANGTTAPTAILTFSSSNSIGPNDVFVIYNSSAAVAISSQGDMTHAVTNFNGDDAIGLYKDNVLIDIIGKIGEQVKWPVDGRTTENATLVRKSSITSPNNEWTANEWNAYPSDTVTYIGSHTMNPVSQKSIISIRASLVEDEYEIDDVINLNASTLTLYYDDQTSESIPLTADMVSLFTTEVYGFQYALVEYQGFRDVIIYYVDKLIPTYTTPILDDVLYEEGLTLADIALPSGFSWNDESISLSLGEHTYQVTYIPSDESHYHIVENINVSLNVVEHRTPILIYEVYGGGGNSGATYTHDYIVLYNATSQNINLNGYSVQYASAAEGSTYTVLALSGIIYHKSYFLIQLYSNGSVGSALPVSANQSGSINMAQTSGKVAITSGLDSISSKNDASVIDFLGYGSTANEFETSQTATLSSSLSAKRTSTIDTNDNGVDFSVQTPNLSYLQDSLTIVDVVPMNIKTYYAIGESIGIDGAYLSLVYNTGSTENVELIESMISGFNSSTLGIFTITIIYGSFTITYEYYVIDYDNIDQVMVYYIDIGETGGIPGESALIQIGSIDVLIDSGANETNSKQALLSFLGEVVTDGVIEYVIATHPDADHIGGMIDVFNAYTISNVIQYSTTSTPSQLQLNYEAAIVSDSAELINVYTLASSVSPFIELTPGIRLQFYNTTYLTSSNNNASSIVFTLEALNTRVLFNGDAESQQEAIYAPLVGDVDIFKMGHHGALAGTSTTLLNYIKPEVAIITNGDYLGNQYAHPTYGALSRIYEYSHLIPIYAVTGGNQTSASRNNQRNGHISVAITSDGYEISSKNYGNNPLELSATDYWNDASNPYRSLGYYYAYATGIASSALKTALYNIINNHTVKTYTYVGTTGIPLTDKDPLNSNNVILLYTGRSQSSSDLGGSVGQWNREHVWPNSHGIYDATPAYSDLHHLRPTDVTVNSIRGNMDFGLVTHSPSTLVNSTYGLASTFSYVDSTYFEPRDEVKGDVARMLFYMATRYEGTNGEPNLELVNGTTSINTATLGDLTTLIAWHLQDPVDAFELNRNHIIYSIQGNRNPFIDHPEYVARIFGG